MLEVHGITHETIETPHSGEPTSLPLLPDLLNFHFPTSITCFVSWLGSIHCDTIFSSFFRAFGLFISKSFFFSILIFNFLDCLYSHLFFHFNVHCFYYYYAGIVHSLFVPFLFLFFSFFQWVAWFVQCFIILLYFLLFRYFFARLFQLLFFSFFKKFKINIITV